MKIIKFQKPISIIISQEIKIYGQNFLHKVAFQLKKIFLTNIIKI